MSSSRTRAHAATVLAQDYPAHLRCLRPSLASLQLSRSDLGLMTAVFEAKFAQAVKTAGCPDDFVKWLISQKLINFESFGVAAPNEEKLAAEVTTVAESNGVKFATIGDKGCVAKLWRASRSAIDAGPTPGIPRVAPDPAAGLSEGADQTIKDLWMKRHNLALSDSVLLVRPLLARLHRELTAASPFWGVYPMEQLRTMACLETSKATLLQIEPGKAVEGVEVAVDTISGHWQIYIRIRACFPHVRVRVDLRS